MTSGAAEEEKEEGEKSETWVFVFFFFLENGERERKSRLFTNVGWWADARMERLKAVLLR
jgi:hypothetical protein